MGIAHMFYYGERGSQFVIGVCAIDVVALFQVDGDTCSAWGGRSCAESTGNGASEGVEGPAGWQRGRLVNGVGLQVSYVRKGGAARGRATAQGEVLKRAGTSGEAESLRSNRGAVEVGHLRYGDAGWKRNGIGRKRAVLIPAAAIEANKAGVERRTGDRDGGVPYAPVETCRNMAAPSQNHGWLTRAERDRDTHRAAG